MSKKTELAAKAMAMIDKKHHGMLIVGSQLKDRKTLRVTTGSLSFDLMLGGGWPLNQWNEIIGIESSGKTVLALKTIAVNQRLDKNYVCLWIAAEHFVTDWAEKLGVDLDRLIIAETNAMEEAYETILNALIERAVDAIVIDSLPALMPSAEYEGVMEDMTIGLAARINSKFFTRKGPPAQRRSLTEVDKPCLGLVINQWRDKIGGYGDPRTTPGGKAKNFAYFTRVEIARDDWLGPKSSPLGQTIRARTLKNKTFPPGRTSTVDFYFEDDLPNHVGDYDVAKEIATIALAYDILVQRGAMYDYGGQTWRGKEAFITEVLGDLTLREQLDKEIRTRLLPGKP